jgi:hypothetical protein
MRACLRRYWERLERARQIGGRETIEVKRRAEESLMISTNSRRVGMS